MYKTFVCVENKKARGFVWRKRERSAQRLCRVLSELLQIELSALFSIVMFHRSFLSKQQETKVVTLFLGGAKRRGG